MTSEEVSNTDMDSDGHDDLHQSLDLVERKKSETDQLVEKEKSLSVQLQPLESNLSPMKPSANLSTENRNSIATTMTSFLIDDILKIRPSKSNSPNQCNSIWNQVQSPTNPQLCPHYMQGRSNYSNHDVHRRSINPVQFGDNFNPIGVPINNFNVQQMTTERYRYFTNYSNPGPSGTMTASVCRPVLHPSHLVPISASNSLQWSPALRTQLQHQHFGGGGSSGSISTAFPGGNVTAVQLQQRQIKRKGGQVRFSNEQTVELERKFVGHKYLTPPERKRISKALRLSERQVKTWFQNRRAKWRRLKQESSILEEEDDGEIDVDDNQDRDKDEVDMDSRFSQRHNYVQSVGTASDISKSAEQWMNVKRALPVSMMHMQMT